jgi:hypothetical protein
MSEIDDLIAHELEIILEKYQRYFSDDSDLTYVRSDEDIPKLQICPHCGGDIMIRNPKGYCDHLYYPEYCKTCKDMIQGKHLENDIIKDEDFEI